MDFLQLAGKRILILGVANRKSVAYHVGRVLAEAGAVCVYGVQSEAIRDSVSGLLAGAEIHVCNVEHEDQIARLRREVSTRQKSPLPLGEGQGEGRLQGLVHSIAFADYSAGPRPFHETPKADFLRSVDVSCYSLVAICRALADLLDPDGSVVTVSIPATQMAAENYGCMGPVKAALESSLCLLAKSFSRFSRVRFNAVAPAPLKTSSSAGVPGFVESYLYAEQVIPRKQAVQTEEVANVAAFLLSPRSSGINAQRIVVDAGMSFNYFDSDLIRRALGGKDEG